jgi:polysaccharide chain length determinant protein (PEP-CTERM system associated)
VIPGRQYTPEDILRRAWARRWLILMPAVLAGTATVAVSSRMPDRYRAETLILVVPQSVPQEYVRATVTSEIQDRLPTISQQILSRTRLERIINDFELYAAERQTRPMEEIVDLMRRNIEVEIVPGSESFRVRFESRDPALATGVTERLAGLFIEENLRDRTVMAEETSAFLESQMEDARERLVEQERKLETYRLEHGPELPTQLQSNIQAIQNAQTQVQALNESLNRDRDRRLLVARQLADLRSEEFLAEPGTGGGAGLQASSTVGQLDQAIAELSALEARLTEEHPDLVRARRLVAELEQKFMQETTTESPLETPVRPPTPSEIARRNRVRELQAEIESLDRQIEAKLITEAEIRQTLETYQARVEAVPTRESELTSLTRDYETIQELYRALLAKREESRIAENLERRQVGEQFKILDPPREPEKPFSPNRRLIDMAGAFAGLFLGVGLAAFLEFSEAGLRDEADVLAAIGVSPLAVIPQILTTAELRRRRRRSVAWSVMTATVLVACATVVVLTFRL